MVAYEIYRRRGSSLIERVRLDADDCVGTTRPAWPKVQLLASFWTEHPCMRGNRSVCVGAGASTDFLRIWTSAHANHVASAALLNTTYLVGGAGAHGRSSRAICEKLLWVEKALRGLAENHWLVFADADAGFRCASLAAPGTAGRRRQPQLERALRSIQMEAWTRRKADPSLLDFDRFGFFAMRNDAAMRALLARWTAVMVTRPLMCLFSTVPMQTSFFEVYHHAGERSMRCTVVHEPSVARRMLLHLVGQRAKRSRQATNRFIKDLDNHTRCIRAMASDGESGASVEVT